MSTGITGVFTHGSRQAGGECSGWTVQPKLGNNVAALRLWNNGTNELSSSVTPTKEIKLRLLRNANGITIAHSLS